MKQSAILVKNEQEANSLSAKIMLVSIGVLISVYLMECLGIFQDDPKVLLVPFIIIALILLMSSMIVKVFKASGGYVKYIMVSSAALSIAIMNMFLSKDVIILYIYAVAIASLYFSRPLCWYSVGFSMTVLTASQIIGAANNWFIDENYKTMDTVIIPVLSRNIELLVLALIFIVLAKRTRKMLENVMGAEQQKEMLDTLTSIKNKSNEVSAVLAESVKQLSSITEQTASSNEQIASNTSRIASGSESTLKYIEDATNTVVQMSKNLNKIAEQGVNIADISVRTNEMTKNSGDIIENAVKEMKLIEKTASESKEIISSLEKRSSEIGRIVELITGVASQTNLLALNAAIESARAGEHGKGFSVVAEQIRQLAEQTQTASKDIAKLIKEVLADTEKAVYAMDKNAELAARGVNIVSQAGDSFQKLSEASKEVNVKIQQVSTVTTDTAQNGDNIVKIVHNIREITSKNTADLQGIAAASQQQLASMQQVSSSVDTIERISLELLDVVAK